MKKIIAILILLVSQAVEAGVPFHLDLSAGYKSDDNVTRAADSKDIKGDSIIQLSASGTYSIPVNEKNSVSILAALELNQYQDYNNLSYHDLSLGAAWYFQPTQGFSAPWYVLTFKLGSQDFDDDHRDNSYYDIELAGGLRITDRMKLRAGIGRLSRDAESARNSRNGSQYDFFDVESTRLYVNMDLKLTRNNTLYTTLSHYDGDVVSTDVYPHPTEFDGHSLPWFADSEYDFGGAWTYRVDAKTLMLTLGDNYALASNQSVDASISSYNSDASYGFTYSGTIVQASYIYRF